MTQEQHLESAEVDFELRAADYLSLPYARVILPESDGTFRGEIMEFPGCISIGETASEALQNLEGAAKSWLMAALDSQQAIPKPVEGSGEYSGKFMVRVPKSLHKKIARISEREGVSLNQFILSSVAIAVGERQVQYRLVKQVTNNFTQYTQYLFIAPSAHAPQSFTQSQVRMVS